eukprot:CAMPEP_0206271966 /NCGR_PEP_ID=MMETSP0047_2-20121206/33731_1 /ASSEMBLY_ACC=CAM_ASM_000192 /TAXON_ID=195065 /ORGANISM="Chroomonas mesostigmatica_cf, Strain CCMP1168" /LENGTH=52 /DNA_ID=CAMNT_0053700805 /DNA_START=128 /DNA_END=282 /DNA_ORIENTATION=+
MGHITKKPLRPNASLDWNCPSEHMRPETSCDQNPRTSSTSVPRRISYVCVHA